MQAACSTRRGHGRCEGGPLAPRDPVGSRLCRTEAETLLPPCASAPGGNAAEGPFTPRWPAVPGWEPLSEPPLPGTASFQRPEGGRPEAVETQGNRPAQPSPEGIPISGPFCLEADFFAPHDPSAGSACSFSVMALHPLDRTLS